MKNVVQFRKAQKSPTKGAKLPGKKKVLNFPELTFLGKPTIFKVQDKNMSKF